MTTEARIEEIKGMVNEANRFQKEGEYEEALEQLNKAFDKINLLPEDQIQQFLLGLTWHYRGSTLQRMGRYDKAVEAIAMAIAFREKDLIARAYSMFQLFICKVYGNIPISDKEVKETKMALSRAFVDKAATIIDVGNFLQNIAYIEQTKGDIEKAISFYCATEVIRLKASDMRGLALTWARLAECYKIDGKNELAMSYGEKAINYFEVTGDVERIKQVEDIFGRK